MIADNNISPPRYGGRMQLTIAWLKTLELNLKKTLSRSDLSKKKWHSPILARSEEKHLRSK